MEILVFLFLAIILISIASEKRSNKKRRYKSYNKKDSFIFRDFKKRNMFYNQDIYNPKKYEPKEYFFKDRFEDLGKNNQSYNQESSCYEKENPEGRADRKGRAGGQRDS